MKTFAMLGLLLPTTLVACGASSTQQHSAVASDSQDVAPPPPPAPPGMAPPEFEEGRQVTPARHLRLRRREQSPSGTAQPGPLPPLPSSAPQECCVSATASLQHHQPTKRFRLPKRIGSTRIRRVSGSSRRRTAGFGSRQAPPQKRSTARPTCTSTPPRMAGLGTSHPGVRALTAMADGSAIRGCRAVTAGWRIHTWWSASGADDEDGKLTLASRALI